MHLAEEGLEAGVGAEGVVDKPRWRKQGNYRDLTEDCLETFQAINLHWHDLRHEYASRLSSAGFPFRRSGTCWAMPPYRRPSAMTTRSWQRCKRLLSA